MRYSITDSSIKDKSGLIRLDFDLHHISGEEPKYGMGFLMFLFEDFLHKKYIKSFPEFHSYLFHDPNGEKTKLFVE